MDWCCIDEDMRTMEQRNNGKISVVVLVSQSVSEKVGKGAAGLLTFPGNIT
jgi:hypothetical protein